MESTGIQSLLVMSLLLTTGLCQQQPLVVPNPITANQPFTVTCEANRVPTVPSDVTFVFSLTLSRNTSANNGDTFFFATYYSLHPTLNKSTIPAGRNWTISLSGSNGSANKNTMRIVLVVGDTRCYDAGVYLCHVIYRDKSGTYINADNPVNVTATAGMGPIGLSVTPPTDYNTNQYKPGDNITFTCTVRGQSTLKIGWRLYVLEQGNDIPSDAVVTNPTATPIGTGSCAEYTILGTLSLQLGNYNQEETYACVVTDSSNTVLGMETKNITIGTPGTSSQQEPMIEPGELTVDRPFIVHCDASRVIVDPGVTAIYRLLVSRSAPPSTDPEFVADYYSTSVLGLPMTRQNIPPERNWSITFTGGNITGSDGHLANRNSMKIVWEVRDTKLEDAGVYYCHIEYYILGGYIAFADATFNMAPTTILPVVSAVEVDTNLSFKITCDAHRVSFPDPDVNPTIVGALVIEARHGMNQTFSKFAEYLSTGPQENLKFQHSPPGSNWNFTFSGSNNGTHNRDSMKIEVLVPGARCSDTGTYRCSAMFYSTDEGTVWLHQDQDVTVAC